MELSGYIVAAGIILAALGLHIHDKVTGKQ